MSNKRPLLLVVVATFLFAGCAGGGGSPSAVLAGATRGTSLEPTVSVAPFVTATPSASATATATTPASVVPSDPASSSPALAADDWPTYHLDAARTGYSPSFPPAKFPLAMAWTKPLDGAVYGQPIVVHSRLIVATENDSVYSLDPATGGVLWNVSLGKPVRKASLPCGNIDPLGITGTPAYDPVTGSVFVVAELAAPAPSHVLFALDAGTGKVRWSRNVDVAGENPTTHQQRAALAVANGYVYVGFGGLAGDCGQYRGKVVGVPATGNGGTVLYRVPVSREGAVWATPGPVVDAKGNLYVSVGNGASTTSYDGSDSVVELNPTLGQVGFFAPKTWAAENAADADLGSAAPTLLPNGLAFIAGKTGTGYILRQGALGGIGGEVASKAVCASFGGTAVVGSDVYVPCSTGLAKITVGPSGAITVDWKAPNANGSPVVGGGAVWTADWNKGVLLAIDPANGATAGSLAVGALPHFVSPTLWRGMVFVGTMSGVAAVKA